MLLWNLGDIYPTEYMEFIFSRVINQIKNTCQDIIYVFEFYNLIGENEKDTLLTNAFNEIIKSSYDEWPVLKMQIVQAIKEGRIDDTYKLLIRTDLLMILNYCNAWQNLTRIDVEINAEKMGETASKIYNSITNGYTKIQEINMKVK